MKTKLALAICFILFATISFAQNKNAFENWKPLLGEWKGEGSGKPGDGGGKFSFQPGLDQKIIVRKSHSEYKSQFNSPDVVHDDLMMIYLDYDGNATKAIYFDNEGHNINYTIKYSDKEIVLTSEKVKGVPVYRLSYNLLDDKTLNTKFEMSRDGVTFIPYIEGKSKKIK